MQWRRCYALTDLSMASTDPAGCLQGKRPPGVLKLAGTVDAAQTPVLLTSANGEGTVYLWELPSFQVHAANCVAAPSHAHRLPLAG